jgi:hypothetical protein
MLWYNKKKRFVLKNNYLFTHESENAEYGNEQSIQYQKEGLDLEFFDTQSNYVDYLWEVLYRAQNEAWSIVITI